MSYHSQRKKTYLPLHQIKEQFLSLSGTVYGYHDNTICFCRDEKFKNKCVSTRLCNDCDLNRSGECPVPFNGTPIAGVS